MRWDEVDRARYERGVQSGWTAERTVAEALRDGIGEIHTIRLVRALFGIDLVEAKELLVHVESGSSLVEHQETILPALQRAVGEEGDGGKSQSSEELEDASPESRMRGKLCAMTVPWEVSPSVPEIHVGVVENADAFATFDAIVLQSGGSQHDEYIDKRIRVLFKHGQWLRTYPVVSDTETLPAGLFDKSCLPLGDGGDLDTYLERFQALWSKSGNCPNPGFYEVLESTWLDEMDARRYGCRHFVLVGHDMWMEVLCTDVSWEYVGDAAAESIDTSTIQDPGGSGLS